MVPPRAQVAFWGESQHFAQAIAEMCDEMQENKKT
jgi:hypothetical protein